MGHAICRESERITTQDVLWGGLLLGLLIAQAFGQPAFAYPTHLLNHHHTELPVQFLVQLLVSGQFERLGGFLFGLSVYRCWQQPPPTPKEVGLGSLGPGIPQTSVPRLARRLLVGLLGIGLLLSLLVWSVTLLLQYALLGFTLLYFRNQSVASLLKWLVGLTGLAIGVAGSVALVFPTGVAPHSWLSWESHADLLLATHSVSQGFSATVSYELMLLGGLLVGRKGLSHPDQGLRVRLSLLQVGLLPLAFLLKGAWVVLALGLMTLPRWVIVYQPLLLAFTGFFGPILVTLVYMLDVGLNMRLTSEFWTRWLGRVGQLGLTNYVLQTMLYPLLLNGYGVLMGGPLSLLGRAVLVVGIFALQLGLSLRWRKHHRQGPLEWVCQQWIYRKGDSSTA